MSSDVDSWSDSQRISIADGIPLGNLFQKLTGIRLNASASPRFRQLSAVSPPVTIEKLGGGLRKDLFYRLHSVFSQEPEVTEYDLIFARSGTALWLCSNAAQLFAELNKALVSQSSAHLDPLQLAASIIDFLTTETSGSSTLDQARYLSQLMLSMGFGLLPADTDWAKRLKNMALGQAEQPESGPMSAFIRWAIEIETATAAAPLDIRESSLEQVAIASSEATGLDLNRWAYILLRLQLSRAAVPLARRALATAGNPDHFPERVRPLLTENVHQYNLAACCDTLGWGLCFEGLYDEAEAQLRQSVEHLERVLQDELLLGAELGLKLHGKEFPWSDGDYCEVHYHLVHAMLGGGKPERAAELVRTMESANPADVWVKRAADLIRTAQFAEAPSQEFRYYDVVLSFAGEDRAYAEALAHGLVERGMAVFYDDFERAALWGENLYEYLTDLYQNRARYCVVLVSKHYLEKRWTRLEWKAIQARCLRERGVYCLPVRLDAAELPGLLPTTDYLSIGRDGIQTIIDAVASKLDQRRRRR